MSGSNEPVQCPSCLAVRNASLAILAQIDQAYPIPIPFMAQGKCQSCEEREK